MKNKLNNLVEFVLSVVEFREKVLSKSKFFECEFSYNNKDGIIIMYCWEVNLLLEQDFCVDDIVQVQAYVSSKKWNNKYFTNLNIKSIKLLEKIGDLSPFIPIENKKIDNSTIINLDEDLPF